ncbi:DEAD/DEAH box helicase [Pantoea endophytica]|uniref:DEAD/DEAH box helicase n=1 Tax=Pantoea endophytica TaxID=92488 RepID=UPI00289760AC|nr:DEAD/DEAH box helicase [Pantoea endophytica]
MDEQSKISNTQQAINILDYWHKIEFFESTDIKDLEDNADGVIQLNIEELQDITSLPWIEPQQVRRAGSDYLPEKKYRYELFFGIFDRDEIFQQAKPFVAENSDIESDALGNEGRTCSIKCKIDHNGVIDSDSFEFSTVTWALGQIAEGGLDRLNFDSYEVDTKKLQQRFKEIITVADNLKKQHHLPSVLTTFEIIAFLKAMAQWTPFTPQIPAPALFIKLNETTPKKIHISSPLDLDLISGLSDIAEKKLLNEPEYSSNSAAHYSNEISILNSFYLHDIELIIQDIKRNKLEANSPLGRYLTGSRKRKADLLLPAGRTLLIDKLRLSQLPAGRWLSDSRHNMSLMQQFAINTLEQELTHQGLYSVNGPPGTGKTTLLRDVIANNIVKRAAILASFDRVEDAFSGSFTIDVNGDTRKIPCLRSELCGYEMVVVSSNNAAVENISRELPQLKSLGDDWQHHDYFKSAARKLAAFSRILKEDEKQEDKTYLIKPLTPEDDCWGLIAVALGKKKNRDRFKERVFTQNHTKAVTTPPADEYRHLFESLKNKDIVSFSTAKKAFIQAQQNYQGIIQEVQQLERLNDLSNIFHQQQLKIEQLRLRIFSLHARTTRCAERLPKWWTLRFGKISRLKVIIKGLKKRLGSALALLELTEQRLSQTRRELDAKQQDCSTLKIKYQDTIFAADDFNIEAEDIQRTAFGQGAILNAARSRLSACALDLHQSWLKEAYKECNLLKVIFSVSDAINGGVADSKACRALWQLLFMIVPVVSSTFASVHRQFMHLGAGDIGWLFIDEAGQATPQQAAGALWRAKRTVVVGDPLQIEPVFTIPPAFVEALAQRAFADDWRQWSPTTQSVQNLADRVNPYGSAQISNKNWLGSPLRVHRRCDEPMFSIANTIAYNNKMLHGRDKRWPTENDIWGESCWLDVCGEVEGKHYVPAQGKKVLMMVKDWFEYHGALPDVYIISPFKQIKNQLKFLLSQELKGIKDINRWIDDRIGTVHTFQGKEEKNVIIVLGLSANNSGGEKWASSKPNLLNVAVTRAQKRVYIIGSKAIWAGCDYFNIANEMLSKMAPPEISEKLEVVQFD